MAEDNSTRLPENTEPEQAQSASHEGHRSRMQQRYLENGLAGFKEHEVLEMLLFRSIVRSNTNPLAHEMLDTCGSMEDVLEMAARQEMSISGAGAKTLEMLRNTRDSLTECFRRVLMQSDRVDGTQFYTAAVWFLRRYPERILLVICDPAGQPEEIGTIGDASPAEILENLRHCLEPDMLCHIACTGREEELAVLRKSRTGVRVGMFLSLTARWEPVWI